MKKYAEGARVDYICIARVLLCQHIPLDQQVFCPFCLSSIELTRLSDKQPMTNSKFVGLNNDRQCFILSMRWPYAIRRSHMIYRVTYANKK